jgi:hypothetical protein
MITIIYIYLNLSDGHKVPEEVRDARTEPTENAPRHCAQQSHLDVHPAGAYINKPSR